MKESRLSIVLRMTTKRKHKKMTLKTKYEALKVLEVPTSTLSIWNQPISTIVCLIDCFWIFWTTCRGNYRQGWWKWRWRIWRTNCTSLKKWSWQENQNSEEIKSVHRGFRFWSFNLKTNPHNQSVKRKCSNKQ